MIEYDIEKLAVEILCSLDDDQILLQEIYGSLYDMFPQAAGDELYRLTYDICKFITIKKMVHLGQYTRNNRLEMLPFNGQKLQNWICRDQQRNSPPPNFDSGIVFELSDETREVLEKTGRWAGRILKDTDSD